MKRRYIEEATTLWNTGDAIRAGGAIYEHLRSEHRPLWAAEILSLCGERLALVPEMEAAVATAQDPARWSEARQVFEALRERTLEADQMAGAHALYRAILQLAENVAKVTFNASGEPAPYDHQAGWRIGGNLKDVLDLAQDHDFERWAWAAFTCEGFSGPAAA